MSFDVESKNGIILPKYDVKYSELLKCFKATVEMCFIGGFNDTNAHDLTNAALEVLKHGFVQNGDQKNKCPTSADEEADKEFDHINEQNFRTLWKLIDDFEWLRIMANLQHNLKVAMSPSYTSLNGSTVKHSYTSFLDWWVKVTLKERCLCACLELLLNDKDLVAAYYSTEAFLRQDVYATAFLMCLSAWEQQQQYLLIQMEKLLQSQYSVGMQSKRFNSHPDMLTLSLYGNYGTTKEREIENHNLYNFVEKYCNKHFAVVRKTKSLTSIRDLCSNDIQYESYDKNSSCNEDAHYRPRCKTFDMHYSKRKIPKHSKIIHNINTSTPPTTTVTTYISPSTSINSNIYNNYGSNITLNSSESGALESKVYSLSSRSSTISVPSHIQVITTDNIKIWTDVVWEQEQQQKHQQMTPSCTIPNIQNDSERGHLSYSINSFISSLFGTPATSTYTNEDGQIGCCHCDSEQQKIELENMCLINALPNQSLGSTTVGSSVFDSFMPICGEKFHQNLYSNQRLFENGISCLDYPKTSATNVNVKNANVNTETLNNEKLPKDCQSLTTFLQTSHLMHNSTQLERENAHFHVSEAIISAMEQIKWNNLMCVAKQEATPMATDCLSNDNTSTSKHFASTYCSEMLEEEYTPYAELGEVYTDAPSAELVGLSLISKFNEQQLPKVSELKWLVSEEDVPQKLLPLPNMTEITKTNNLVLQSITRGTQYWAPPRPQIIFTEHSHSNRKQVLQKQNYRCAGCGMRVSLQDINTFRYCTYLGKYHCTGCHRNHVSTIPAKILKTWDFKCYPVSAFAYRLLDEIYTYPLFYVPDLNPALYVKIKKLRKARLKRIRLKFVKDFISTCRFAMENGENYFINVPNHITNDIENWSIADFTGAQNETLQKCIERLIEKCEKHIHNCMLCTARGYFCEFCKSNEVIFPWSTNIMRCDQCGCCYHRKCWQTILQNCCRCERIKKRKKDEPPDET